MNKAVIILYNCHTIEHDWSISSLMSSTNSNSPHVPPPKPILLASVLSIKYGLNAPNCTLTRNWFFSVYLPKWQRTWWASRRSVFTRGIVPFWLAPDLRYPFRQRARARLLRWRQEVGREVWNLKVCNAVANRDCSLREIYHDRNLKFPDVFDSTLTTPPVHFISYDSILIWIGSKTGLIVISCSVEAPDDVKIEELQKVEVPPGLHVDTIDFQME